MGGRSQPLGVASAAAASGWRSQPLTKFNGASETVVKIFHYLCRCLFFITYLLTLIYRIMAKAYLTASKRIGSVGGETYSVVKGQTIVRAKPISVANPRTVNQMLQRSIFLDAVRFYQHSNQNFFKMAFEDRRQTESDYNAFMRTNSNRGVHVTKAMSDNPFFPALGNWTISRGSLPSAQCEWIPLGNPLFLVHCGETVAEQREIETIGEVCGFLKSKYSLREGDIVTVGLVTSSLMDVNENTLEPVFENPIAPQWFLNQFRIDTTSTVPVTTYNLNAAVMEDGSVVIAIDTPTLAACAGFCVFSRNTDGGLKVSTSDIVLNASATTIINKMQQSSFIERVVADWSASEGAILQGSLS